MKPYFEENGITIYHADCREVLPSLQSVDAVATDPPYGVNLGEANTGQERERGRQIYSMFADTPEYLESVVIPSFSAALSISKRGALTPGNRNAFLYPKPDDIGVWYHPAGSGRGKWGFVLAHLILYYGPDPRGGQKATASSCSWRDNLSVSGYLKVHPCPKPLKFAKWLVGKVSLEGETVLDPFCGTGTTLEAAKDLGRKAIGIEIEERYCEIAAKRMAQQVLEFA
jgi:site-specific DNA-methyltransferase (adenine-specific)